jgi:hypothetical protein
MDRSAPTPPIATTFRQRIFADAALLPLPVYRDFIEMLYSMRLPIFGLGAVFVGIAILVGLHWATPFFICSLQPARSRQSQGLPPSPPSTAQRPSLALRSSGAGSAAMLRAI